MKPERFLSFAEPFTDPILMLSGDGAIQSANTAARALIGPKPIEFESTRLEDLVTDSTESVQAFLTLCLRNRQMIVGSLTWSSSGESVPTRAEGARLHHEKSESAPSLIVRCIPKRRATARFMVLNDLLDALNREVKFRKQAESRLLEQAERLARSNNDLQQFAYIASHDLQQPLRTIASFSELLQKRYGDQLDEKANHFIDTVVAASTRMSAMIRDVLTYSRELEPGNPVFTSVDTKSVVDGVLSDLSAAIEESGADVVVANLPSVQAERTGLLHVFQNLISNAIKYRGSDPPRIRVAAQQQGTEWIFSVSDNGKGIEPADREVVFGLFKRIGRNDQAGTGIGLALCKKIIERLGGRIWVEPGETSGSVFKFTIPTSSRMAGRT